MIMSAIELTNFKSFGPESIHFPLSPLSVFVGENNSGKSNALLALDLFRHFSKKKVNKGHFHGLDPSRPITIKLSYGYLSDEEKRLFRRHLGHDETLTITQTIRCVGPDAAGGHESDGDDAAANDVLDVAEEKTASYARSGIDWLDDPPTTKRNIAKAWKAELVVGTIDFKTWSGLSPDEPPSKEELATRVNAFWHEHWDDIPKIQEPTGTQPLGWPNKLMGNLPEVVFIPALKTIADEAKFTKTSPFGSLLNWLLASVQADLRRDIQARLDTTFADALAALPKELDEESGEAITRLELINRTLNKHLLRAFNASLKVAFRKPEVDDAIFGETTLSADDGLVTDIADKGHGLQRAAILAIIRTYLALRSRLELATRQLGRVSLLIEEPEIYLHPTVKRNAYALFRELANGGDQVIYSTHDGHFIDVEHFREIRLFRRASIQKVPRSRVDYVSEDILLGVWHKISGREDIKIESVRERLRNVYNPHRNEGFLARMVILCEGPTERGTFPLYFAALGFDLDEHGIAVVDVGSVDLLSYFYLLFVEFGIPVFVVWDGDRPESNDLLSLGDEDRKTAEKKSKRNAYLAKLCGVTLPMRGDGTYFTDSDMVWDRCAMFVAQYESSSMTLLPKSEQVKANAKALYGTDSKPIIARYYARHAIAVGKKQGNIAKYIPSIFKDMKEKLLRLQPASKQSDVLRLRNHE